MRKARIQQLPLAETTADHPKAKELAKSSEILDSYSTIYDLMLQVLTMAGNDGARGMSGEQVLRAAIIKQIEGFSYRELTFNLMDSRVYSWFCRIGIWQAFKKSALQRGIKAISTGIWERINRILVGYADNKGIEGCIPILSQLNKHARGLQYRSLAAKIV